MEAKANNHKHLEERIARICWNTNGWQYPSGDEGKSSGVFAYEQKQHFGHEEWLFDKTKDISGYHYAYLQPVNRDCFRSKDFNIHLITFSKETGKLYLGMIKNVHCLSEQEANYVYETYKKRGWIIEMKKAIKEVGGNPQLMEKESINVFNVRFKFEDVDVDLNTPRVLSEDDPNTRGLYYQLLHKKSPFLFGREEPSDNILPREGVEQKSEKTIVGIREYKKYTYNPIHNIMQNGVKKYLESTEDYNLVKLEVNNVDVTAKTKDGEWHFFELKTSTPRQCIREALGQILEYAHYPTENRASKLFIVGQTELSTKEKEYMKYLRTIYNLPVWYRCYFNSTGKLGKEE